MKRIFLIITAVLGSVGCENLYCQTDYNPNYRGGTFVNDMIWSRRAARKRAAKARTGRTTNAGAKTPISKPAAKFPKNKPAEKPLEAGIPYVRIDQDLYNELPNMAAYTVTFTFTPEIPGKSVIKKSIHTASVRERRNLTVFPKGNIF